MRIPLLGLLLLLAAALAYAAPPKQVTLEVRNMTCQACSITIKQALGRAEGAIRTEVDTKAGIVTVHFDPQRTTASELARAVSKAGFPARPRANGG